MIRLTSIEEAIVVITAVMFLFLVVKFYRIIISIIHFLLICLGILFLIKTFELPIAYIYSPFLNITRLLYNHVFGS